MTELLIYPTVCVEWVAQPGVVYTLLFSENMLDWEVVPAYDNYTTDKVETQRMWRGKNEKKGFFKLEEEDVAI